jgi:hypothetical protein
MAALIPLPPLNAEGLFMYGMVGLGLAVGFAFAVPIAEKVQANLSGMMPAGKTNSKSY